MDYHPRHAEDRLRELARYFKVVLVTGARQVGKSTLLAHVFPDVGSIVFDPARDLYSARSDPDLFLDSFRPPVVFDEIQYAPEVLPALKRRVDLSDARGQYFLTGSQNLAMLRSVSESLAGRVGVLQLEGMTPHEAARMVATPSWLAAYLDSPETFHDVYCGPASGGSAGVLDVEGGLARHLWRGSLPGLLGVPDAVVPEYLRSCVLTYLERDIRTMADIRDLTSFDRFLGLNAALTAQEVNDAQLGREIGTSAPTARRWREMLVHTHQWRELPPYHGNTIKRLSGKRKGYLTDTGLASYLQRMTSPAAVFVNPLLGALFETAVVGFVFQQFVRMPVPPNAYHWRTAGGAEVDLVLERDGRLYPVEVRCKTTLTGHDMRGLRAFRETYGERVAPGLLVYAGPYVRRLDQHTTAVPWNLV